MNGFLSILKRLCYVANFNWNIYILKGKLLVQLSSYTTIRSVIVLLDKYHLCQSI